MKSTIVYLVAACGLMLTPTATANENHDENASRASTLADDQNQTMQIVGTYPHCMPFAETTPDPPFIHFYSRCMCPTPDGSSILCEFLP